MPGRFLAAVCLLLISCQPPLYLRVAIDTIPDKTQSLVVLAVHAGKATPTEPSPFVIVPPAPPTGTLILALPDGFSGDIQVDVGATDQPGGQGCLLATGGAQEDTFGGPGDSLRVSLSPLSAAACPVKQPMLLSAMPGLGSTKGGDMVTLRGWGFLPGAAVTMGGQSAHVSFVSASQLVVTTPAHAGLGLTPIIVTNPDGSLDSRSDLFRFYTNSLSFGEVVLDSGMDYSSIGDWGPYVAVGHFGSSAEVDVAVSLPKKNAIRVFSLNGGMIQAGSVTDYPLGNDPGSSISNVPGNLIAADFDKDGSLDLAVANVNSPSLQILTNDGTGRFAVGKPFFGGGTSAGRRSIAAGDLNGDGLVDLVVGTQYDPSIYLLFNEGLGNSAGLGNFASQPLAGIPPGCGLLSLAIGDVGVPDQPDLIVTAMCPGQSSWGCLYQNRGHGAFDGASCAMIGAAQDSMVSVDISGSGQDSLIGLTYLGASLTFAQNAMNTVNPKTLPLSPTPSIPNELQLNALPGLTYVISGDFNKDGKPDLAVADFQSSAVSVFIAKNAPAGTFGPVTNYGVGNAPNSMTTGDFNGDGWLDLAAENWGSNSVSLLLNTAGGATTFGTASTIIVGPSRGQITSADFNGDGRTDLAMSLSDGHVGVLLNKGGGQFFPLSVYSTNGPPNGIVAGDFNGDSLLDLAVTTEGSNVLVLPNLGAGVFGSGSTFTTTAGGFSALAAADFNGDGKLDLAASFVNTNNINVLLNQGDFGNPGYNFAFGPVAAYTTGLASFSLTTGDLNGDGHVDIAVIDQSDNTISVHLNLGNGVFAPAANMVAGVYPCTVKAADFNADGKLDLAVGSASNGTINVFFNLGGGRFGPTSASLAVGDLNGDGLPDLAVPRPDSGNLQIFLNQQGQDFAGATTNPSVSGCARPRVASIFDTRNTGRKSLIVVGDGCISTLPNLSN